MINNETVLTEYSKISSIRAVSRKLGISRTAIRRSLVGSNIHIMDSRSAQLSIGYITEKNKFVLSSREKAYLYGLVMGDLTPVRKSNYTLKLITHSTHRTFMELLCKTFEKYGQSNYRETKSKTMFRFQSHIDLESFSFLLDSKNEIIPNWIHSDNFFDFLAGFIDSDGSVILRKSGKYFQFVIRFFGQNLNLLIEVKTRLEVLGYDVSIHKGHSKGDLSYHKCIKFEYNKDYFTLETYKKSQTIDLLKKIPIRHPEKIAKREMIFNINNRNVIYWKDVETEVKELKSKIKQTVLSKTSL